jgi:hypothetical protein
MRWSRCRSAKRPRSICFAADASWLAVAGAGGISVVHVDDGSVRLRIPGADTGHLTLATPRGGSSLGADDLNRQRRYPAWLWEIWPADEWCLLHEIPGHDVAVTAIVASPDDRWLATTDDGGGVGTVRILDPGRERW